jgi:hypothetical protein
VPWRRWWEKQCAAGWLRVREGRHDTASLPPEAHTLEGPEAMAMAKEKAGPVPFFVTGIISE